jgi:hypothetical protein
MLGRSNFEQVQNLKPIEEFVKLLDTWRIGVSNWPALRAIHQTLQKENPPYRFNREEIEASTESATQARIGLEAQLYRVISEMIKNAYQESELQLAQLNANENLFSGPLVEFKQALLSQPHTVLFNKTYKRQILITNDISKSILDDHSNTIRDNAKNHLVVIVGPTNLRTHTRKGIMIFEVDQKIAEKNIERLSNWLKLSNEDLSETDAPA